MLRAMKKVFTPLCCLLLLGSSYLSAQEVPVAQNHSPSDHVHHFSARYQVGYRGLNMEPMRIGSLENPVTVQEYCDFLNDMAPSDNSWLGSVYYDSDLMNTDRDLWSSSYACIYRTGKSPHFKYTPLLGCKNDIIDAVRHAYTSDYKPLSLQFEEWRKNVKEQ